MEETFTEILETGMKVEWNENLILDSPEMQQSTLYWAVKQSAAEKESFILQDGTHSFILQVWMEMIKTLKNWKVSKVCTS